MQYETLDKYSHVLYTPNLSFSHLMKSINCSNLLKIINAILI